MQAAPTCANGRGLSLEAIDLSDNELNDHARQAATSVQRLALQWLTDGTADPAIRRRLRQVAKHHQIEPPNKRELPELLNRFQDHRWWRRALRKRFRVIEHAAILSGRVHKHAAPYVSDKALRRAARDRRRVAELLASLDAINQSTGQVLPLDELAKASLANPANRRKAMMVRLKGIERHAQSRGEEARMLTITCPSRMHARREASGQANRRYDGTSPRLAQAYLNKVWRLAMSRLRHEGITVRGLRTVEPNHDGTPHWHVIIFTSPAHTEKVIRTLRSCALIDSSEEPGAAQRRFDVKVIDPAQGGALAYAAKYVSKGIDGEGIDRDHETGEDGASSAVRIVSWARLWGIRQFQFFGVPAITPTRELYRVDHVALPSPALQAAHDACKANDYAAWLDACEAHALSFRVEYVERPSSRYGGETSRRICGLAASACDLANTVQLVTRGDEWRIEPRRSEATGGEIAAPWTRFNNCAPVDFIEDFGADTADERSQRERVCGLATTRPPPRRPATQIARPPC